MNSRKRGPAVRATITELGLCTAAPFLLSPSARRGQRLLDYHYLAVHFSDTLQPSVVVYSTLSSPIAINNTFRGS